MSICTYACNQRLRPAIPRRFNPGSIFSHSTRLLKKKKKKYTYLAYEGDLLGAGAGAGGATKGAGAGAGGASVGAWSHILRRRFLAGLASPNPEGGPEENPKPFFLEVDPRFKSSYIFCASFWQKGHKIRALQMPISLVFPPALLPKI